MLAFRRRRAFTLIELLVVISVISLLVSILLPALAGAREAARTAACQSTLRSIVQASASYLTDNKEWIPHGTNSPWYDDYKGVNGVWYNTSNAYFSYYAPRVNQVRHVVGIGQLMFESYMPERKEAFACPQSSLREDAGYNFATVDIDTQFPEAGYASYTSGLNPASNNYYRTQLTSSSSGTLSTTYSIRGPMVRITELRANTSWPGISTNPTSGYWGSSLQSPSEWSFFADHEQARQTIISIVGTAPGASPVGYWGRLHKAGFNVAFADGHVRMWEDSDRSTVWALPNVRNYGSGWAMPIFD